MKTFYKSGMLVLIFLNVFCIRAQNNFNKLDEKGNKIGPANSGLLKLNNPNN